MSSMMKTIILSLLPAYALGQAATISLFQDTACATPVPGAGWTEVDADTCDTGPFQTGWSSARINNTDEIANKGNVNTITFYTKNDCGCPSCGSHGYNSDDTGCLTEFGFTANAVGFFESTPT